MNSIIPVSRKVTDRFHDDLPRFYDVSDRAYTPTFEGELPEETKLYTYRGLMKEHPEVAKQLYLSTFAQKVKRKLHSMQVNWLTFYQFKFPVEFDLRISFEERKITVVFTKIHRVSLAKQILAPQLRYEKNGWVPQPELLEELKKDPDFEVDLRHLDRLDTNSHWFKIQTQVLQNLKKRMEDHFNLVWADKELNAIHFNSNIEQYCNSIYDVDLREYI